MNKKTKALLAGILVSSILVTGCSSSNGNNNAINNEHGVSEDSGSSEIKYISTKELEEKLDDESVAIVDVRSSESYNGWKVDGEERSGHIEGAINFPNEWIELSEKSLEEELTKQGLIEDREIIIYGINKESAEILAETLLEIGYTDIAVYEEGILEWSKDDSLPMESLERYSQLVSPRWVNELITDGNPEEYDNDKYIILEVSWGEDGPGEYIPGAIHLNTDEVEEEPLWNFKSDDELVEAVTNLGITYDTTVILYGEDTTAAARVANILMYLGVEDVRVLDGGYNAWKNGEYEVSKEMGEISPVDSFGIEYPQNPQYVIGTEKVREMLNDDNARVVSIRSWEEHIGNTSGYSYIEPKGRIDGDVWGYAGENPWDMSDYRNIDNTMISYNEILERWEKFGITGENEVTFYCGTGWRASETFFYAYLAGWDNISVYDGGWYEWSEDSLNPILIGEPE